MKIDYKETPSDLLARINIHEKFGARNIDDWMIETVPLKEGMHILDVGCGAGKQCFSYFDTLHGNAQIVGGDVSEELLAKAKEENRRRGTDIVFTELDFNKPFAFDDDSFDLASCSFAIYYAENIPFTIKEMHRVLKPGGYLFTTGPMPENKKTFYDIIKEATNKVIPPMPGSSRYSTEILDAVKALFAHTDLIIFENPLTFDEAEPFLVYTRASLSEDRKLWSSFFEGQDEFESVMHKIKAVTEKRIQKDGKIVMTKVVGGILAKK
ncbi:MAG TPA: methyltransferase domain-containing protein [Anaerolineaceae bacterium]|jgi:ubiquinone/menaquinone biosynthesis C-methylase UbiE|nr:methyltransferase domain-containing protein [Anaerolineaceae bacterium]